MHYPVSLHLQPALAGLGHSKGQFPVAEAWSQALLSLLMCAELEPEEIRSVAGAIAAFEAASPRKGSAAS